MSTKFGIPLYPVDDAILLDQDGELQPYISESFFHDVNKNGFQPMDLIQEK